MVGWVELTVFSLHRRYPTVERRARLTSHTLYYPLPHDSDICDAVLLKCSKPTEEVHSEVTLRRGEGLKGGLTPACNQDDDDVKPMKAFRNATDCWGVKIDVEGSRVNSGWPQSQVEVYCPTYGSDPPLFPCLAICIYVCLPVCLSVYHIIINTYHMLYASDMDLCLEQSEWLGNVAVQYICQCYLPLTSHSLWKRGMVVPCHFRNQCTSSLLENCGQWSALRR